MKNVNNQNQWIKISGLSGILAPTLAFFLIFISILNYQNFSWIENTLSDLGISTGVSSLLFNYGLIVSGALFVVYSFGIFNFFHNKLMAKIGACVLLLTALMMSAIGVFPENIAPTHAYVSTLFFLLFPISTSLLAINFYFMKKIKLAFISILAIIVAVVAFVLINQSGQGIAILEVVHVLAMFVLPIILGYKMFKGNL